MTKKLINLFLIFLPIIFLTAANGPRDPFAPLATKWSGLPDRSLLEQYDLSQLNVVGVIYGTKEPRVLFRDPTGVTHIATIENKVGKLGGSITKIDKSSIVIREEVSKLDGGKEVRFITMPLKR